jgi:hypothetical protein
MHDTPRLPVIAAVVVYEMSSLPALGANGAEFGCFAGNEVWLPNI